MGMEKISKWVEEAKEIATETEKVFGNLTESRLNWKPEENQWSIAQCFDHIMITNKAYFSCMKDLIEGNCNDSLWKSFPAVTNFFGKALVDSLNPESTRKLDAPQIFRPATATYPKSIIADFLQHQKELIALIEKTETIDTEKAIFCSPVAKFVTFTIEDAVNMLLHHERRHFVQAQAVLEQETLLAKAEETKGETEHTIVQAQVSSNLKLQV